jgi:CopG family nickel-responsive transcriptional regulator
MSNISRIGVAIDSDLLTQFDAFIGERGYLSRSEAFRDLIRDALIQVATERPSREVVGTLTLLYDHHQRHLSDKLTALQHDHHASILATVHVHLDHANCLEVLMLRGKAQTVRKIAELLIATKGVKHGKLNLTVAEPAAH